MAYEIKEKIENVDLRPTAENLINWVVTGDVKGKWFYKVKDNQNVQE